MSGPQTQRLTDFINVDLSVARVGAGGFGLVYMGPDRLRGRWMALKTLRPELLALRPHLRDLFLTECLTWVGLWNHPNLLVAESATEIDGHIFLYLDYAEHGSLRDQLALNLPFTIRLAWAQHIAAGLLALHTPDPEFLRPHPLIHRDLKPENVLVHKFGFAQITDFGLAAAIGDALAQAEQPDALEAFAIVEQLAEQAGQSSTTRLAHTTRATRTARFHTRTLGPGASGATQGGAARLGGVGTIAYMPPEQWDVDGIVGTPADLYAFGLILSELLAGRHGLADLEAELDEEGWYQLHLNGVPRPLRSGPAEGASRLPVEVEQLYQALLAKRSEDRPTAGEALTILRQAATQLGEDPYTPPDIFPRTDELRLMNWTNWAVTCASFERFEEALERNKRALALGPHETIVLNSQGNIVAALGRKARKAGKIAEGDRLLEEALGCYDQAVDAATTDARRVRSQGTKAIPLGELGRYAEAEAIYATVLALEPENGTTWHNRASNGRHWARSEVKAGRRDVARRIYALAESHAQQAVRVDPNSRVNRDLLTIIQQERAGLGL